MTGFLKEIDQRLRVLAEQPTAVIHKDWVQVVMSTLRQHLEALGQQRRYPILMFYCNWCQHKDLHRGIVQDLLEKITEIIVDDTTGHPADRISEILSLTTFRSDIRDILKKGLGVQAGLFEDYDNWRKFTELLFPFILEKPLKRKRKAKTHHWVELLELFDNGGHVFWRIRVEPGGSNFIGPLLRTEDALNAQ
ncbi:hypothetical protein KW790_01690 [Candidatus Parcubacteria bacterium]|nr:hypothetical protein [Candidatus Parcubacteria bacterium]